ncbi:unnamed protein product [Zymoseptoria tritici ST99CH_1A5]|nr:unnamed protein product [Zymoseptoria tritici ST99CH_1A5]
MDSFVSLVPTSRTASAFCRISKARNHLPSCPNGRKATLSLVTLRLIKSRLIRPPLDPGTAGTFSVPVTLLPSLRVVSAIPPHTRTRPLHFNFIQPTTTPAKNHDIDQTYPPHGHIPLDHLIETPRTTNASTRLDTPPLPPSTIATLAPGILFLPSHAKRPSPPIPSNTAKLSSRTILQRAPSGGITFADKVNTSPPLCVQSAERKMNTNSIDKENRRRRRSSSLMYQEPPESLEQQSDQAILPNLNSQWVNAKGAWMIHIILILLLKIIYDIVPSISQETSWTLVNITYMFGSYLMFHWVRGIPFEFNAGAYDNLNMWEQIDDGEQYTPAKKFLLSVPICLFLISTHYTHYDLAYFMINFLATLAVVVPKLPALHRMRLSIFNNYGPEPHEQEQR